MLVRPAVEAGEKLGFLPGDLTQKIDPYLRPLYDALYEMLGFEKVAKLIEKQVIEVAPLAYMRGRTLNNSFVGFGSRAVITGDMSQVDLPRGTKSGLRHSLEILADIEEIHVTRFDSKDVVRHQLVQKIVQAYDKYDEAQEAIKEAKKQSRLLEQSQAQSQAASLAIGVTDNNAPIDKAPIDNAPIDIGIAE